MDEYIGLKEDSQDKYEIVLAYNLLPGDVILYHNQVVTVESFIDHEEATEIKTIPPYPPEYIDFDLPLVKIVRNEQ